MKFLITQCIYTEKYLKKGNLKNRFPPSPPMSNRYKQHLGRLFCPDLSLVISQCQNKVSCTLAILNYMQNFELNFPTTQF